MTRVSMHDQPNGLERLRVEVDRLRAEMKEMRDDLEYHLMFCQASPPGQVELYGVL
jgi:hypothetical protein